MRIRKATIEDAKQIIEFKRRSIPICAKKFYPQNIISHWANGDNLDRLRESIKNGRERFVAEENGRVVGEASLDKDGKTMKTLYVDIDDQGKGIGKALLEKCENELRKNKIKKVEIIAALSAEGFYASQGYKTIEKKVIDFFGMKMENAIMNKKL